MPEPDVLPPLVIDLPESVTWDDEADVVIVGFGAAGACTALEVGERAPAADVLIVERFDGGGATAISGGVVYAGGTRHQRAAGFDDDAEQTFNYLRREVGDAVTETTLHRFCDTSNANLEWLERHGVPFGSALHEGKTSYPPNGRFLYYSGNEKVDSYAAEARPAPRGHRTVGRNWTGTVMFDALRRSVAAAGTRVLTHSPVQRLVVDGAGRVVGVEVRPLPESHYRRHRALYRRVNPARPMQNRRAERAITDARALESATGGRRLIRARAGVVLATGGFIYNTDMLDRYAAANCAANAMALVRVGSMGCSGAGIRLGASVGGAVGRMGTVMLGRSMSPPAALLEGVIVNRAGRRLVNEDIYAGFLGNALCEQPSAKAWLVLDAVSLRRVLRQTLPSGDGNFYILKLPNLANLLFGGTRRARTLEALAGRCGIDATGLADEIATYNRAVSAEGADPLGKAAEYLRPITVPPFFALDMALSNPLAPTLSMTLGGLRVDEESGLVRRDGDTPVPGLYAVGRAAVGLSSNNYFSGISLADCVYSGRRAGARLAASCPAVGA